MNALLSARNTISRFLFLAGGLCVAGALMTTKSSAQSNNEVISSIQFEQIPFRNLNLHYALSGNPNKPGILFMHGTPGDWGAFEGYLSDQQLQKDYLLVSIDRPGWGKSKAEKKDKSLIEFSAQAEAAQSVMAQFPDKNWLVVGHSLGASIAPKIALIEPSKTRGLLLLAGSLKPKYGAPRWFNTAGSLLAIKWLVPKNLRYSNDEIMALKKQLKQMDTELRSSKLETQVIVIQGMKDKLVNPKNSAYVADAWSQTFNDIKVIELQEAGHFLPWQETELIKQSIRQFDLN